MSDCWCCDRGAPVSPRTIFNRPALSALIDYSLRPGVAATTYLAFMLDKSKQVQLPARLRVQSKPAPGQQPATFETEAALNAIATINRARVLPVPAADLENFGANSNQAIVLSN